jgi:hypothetical protein
VNTAWCVRFVVRPLYAPLQRAFSGRVPVMTAEARNSTQISLYG